MALCPAVFDRHVLSLNEARLFETLLERSHVWSFFRRLDVHESDYLHRRLLRARHKRPRRRRTAKERDELAPLHVLSQVLTGPAREGLCLLQGLLICGICGRRLGVRYTGNGGLYPIYQCNWRHREALSRKGLYECGLQAARRCHC
jgi:Recombinase zinc beta ribbon domain